MDSSVIIETVKKYGFTEYEAKCYLALFEKESLSVGEIANLAGVPRANIYGIMQKLLAKGLCVSLPGAIKKYSASDPGIFRNELNKSLDESRKTIDSLTTELASLYQKSRANGNPLEYIEVLKNPEQIHRKYIELYSKAHKEVLGFSKPPFSYSTKEQLDEQGAAQFEAAKRKVLQRGIIQMPRREEVKPYFENLIATRRILKGNKKYQVLRFIDELPVKLHIFDEKVCFFGLEDPVKTKTSLTMLLTEHEAMAKSFKLLFQTFWRKAHDYYIIDNKKHYLYKENYEKP